ncbi:MAG: hypothetical protein RL264_2286 [Bacteroidota bacterium]|jgi:peptidoglycan/LPS O-acetylase OafA/YrhL
MKRIHNLDYLRGLAAFGILIYHYLSWTVGEFNSASVIGRIGIYGVSIFYILSGLTLYLVYNQKLNFSFEEVVNFFKKRVFRIFPLMWMVVFVSILISPDAPNLYDLALNLSGLFGFINWDKYFAVGLWSIGNELVFYCFFILFLFTLKKNQILFVILSIAVFCVFIYFTFSDVYSFDNSLYTSENWKVYINPLNQLFLFLSGIIMGYLFKERNVKKEVVYTILILGIIGFIFYPQSGDRLNIVIGIPRLVFTLSCIFICFGFYKFNQNLPKLIDVSLVFLGEISYSLYLIHPIVFGRMRIVINYISAHFIKLHFSITIALSIIASLLVSYLVYTYYEKYFIRLGNKKSL